MARKTKRIVAPIVHVKREPATPTEVINDVVGKFKADIERLDVRKAEFIENVVKNVGYALEWADSLIQLEYYASQYKRILDVFEEKKTGDAVEDFLILRTLLTRVRDENRKSLLNDWLRGNSTSPAHNSVQHNRRAGASHMEGQLEYIFYAVNEAHEALTTEPK